MFKHLLSVGGFTLLSRATGFVRDIMLGAVLGAGVLADAFVIAFRLPNHFRAIFGEGAFNAAYVPNYARVLETEGADKAKAFSGQILTLVLISQIALLVAALIFTADLVRLLAPGFEADPEKFALAVTLTRLTFPYLLSVTLVTLLSGTLNAHRHFAAAAFAPVLLNVSMMSALAIAFLFPSLLPSAGHAAALGVSFAGVAEFLLVWRAAHKAGLASLPVWPRWSAEVRQFFVTLLPAVIGSAGVQIAIFADTIIGSLLPTGGPSSIYYADRIYQLPIGVIGIAAGTVLLPEMSRRLSAGDHSGAYHAQSRTMALTILLSAPFLIAFLVLPDLIMRLVFVRGAFTPKDADAAALVLSAYGLGLMAVVLIRSAVASFQAQGDTKTPMLISLFAVAANVGLKIVLFTPMGAAGLALATAVGAWINLALLCALALHSKMMRLDGMFWKMMSGIGLATLALLLVAVFGQSLSYELTKGLGSWSGLAHLCVLAVAGLTTYVGVVLMALRLLRVPLGQWRLSPSSLVKDER